MVPAGVLGGRDCPPSRTFVQRGDELIRVKPHRMQELRGGDTVIKLSSGGAGIGDPSERDPEAVRVDVANEFVSLEAAERIYRVALDSDTLEVDEARTKELRSKPAKPVPIVIDEKRLTVGLGE
jgi:N-methylhydantoinase B